MLSKIHCTCQDNTHLSKIHTLTLVKILLHYHAPALLDWSSAIMSTSTNMAEQALPPIVTDPSTTLLAVGAAADPPAAAMFTSREVRPCLTVLPHTQTHFTPLKTLATQFSSAMSLSVIVKVGSKDRWAKEKDALPPSFKRESCSSITDIESKQARLDLSVVKISAST